MVLSIISLFFSLTLLVLLIIKRRSEIVFMREWQRRYDEFKVAFYKYIADKENEIQDLKNKLNKK